MLKANQGIGPSLMVESRKGKLEMAESIELVPEQPEREGWIADALLESENFNVGQWLQEHGFDLGRPIERHRSDRRGVDWFAQFNPARKNVHNCMFSAPQRTES